MPVYTVESARERKRKQTDFGEKIDFGINFKEHGEEVSWFTNATTPMPKAGDKLEGDISQSDFGPKFRKARANGFGGRTPRDSGRIERQHSQEMAIRAVALIHDIDPARLEVEKLADVITFWTDWFVADLDTGSSAATGGDRTSASPPAGARSSSGAAPGNEATTAQKRAITRGLHRLQCSDDLVREIAAKMSTDGVLTKPRASELLDLINQDEMTHERLLDTLGIVGRSEMPEPDMLDLVETPASKPIEDDDSIPF